MSVLSHNTTQHHTTHQQKSKSRRDLLQLVDHTRDETLPSLGVHVHDEPNNECTWMVLPPERRRGRQEREVEDLKPEARGVVEPGDTTWADDDGDDVEPPFT